MYTNCLYYFHSFLLFYLCLDNQPEETPQIDQDSIADSVNPHINISWNPLPVGEGGEFLEIYVVEIRITNRALRGKRADDVFTEYVDKDTTSFQYIGVKPFTTYDTQVFASLIIDGRNLRVALTSTLSVDSPESGMYVCMYVSNNMMYVLMLLL